MQRGSEGGEEKKKKKKLGIGSKRVLQRCDRSLQGGGEGVVSKATISFKGAPKKKRVALFLSVLLRGCCVGFAPTPTK